MGESELIGIIRDVHAQYAVLFGQVITINFAMIVATYYFLHRSPLLFRIAAFGFYAVGMLALVGLLLQQGNYKFEALGALAAVAPEHRSQMASSVLALNQSWLAKATSLFLNTSLWVLVLAIAYLLFRWKGDRDARLPATPAE